MRIERVVAGTASVELRTETGCSFTLKPRRPGASGGKPAHYADVVDVVELLASLRVLDLSGGDGDAGTRLLADLGADVLKVEPPGGSPSRTRAPTLHGASLRFALHNANKRSTVLDPSDPDDRGRFAELAASSDIVVDSGYPGQAAAYGTSCADLADRYHIGDRRCASRMGRAGCVLPQVALRHRGLHRLCPVRRGRDGARSGVRGARAGRCRPPRT